MGLDVGFVSKSPFPLKLIQLIFPSVSIGYDVTKPVLT